MIWTGVPAPALVLCAALYFVRIFFITAGYHRYFSHRSFRTGRVFQFILAFGGASAHGVVAFLCRGRTRETG